MKPAKAQFILLIFSLSLFSCTNLRQLPTYWESEMLSDTVKPTGFDPLTKVGWTSYNDSSHLFFAVDLLDPGVQMSVLRSGLTIYLDTTGKLKEDCSITYPIVKQSPVRREEPSSRSLSVQNRNRQEQISPVEKMVSNIESMELIWKQNDKLYRVNPSLNDTDFITLVALDSMNFLSMIIGVPFKLLHPLGIEGVNELTVGFGVPMGGRRSGGQMMSGDQRQSMRSGGGGGRGGGGGGGSRGGGGGQMGGGGAPGGMSSAGPVLEKFWYRTTIQKGS